VDYGIKIENLDVVIPNNLRNSMVCELVDANGQWNEEILKDWLPVVFWIE
jgi:hypothetical protein